MPTRPSVNSPGRDGDVAATRRKLGELVASRRWRDALRVREQALRRRPDLDLQPTEARLWVMEGQQAAAEGQAKRAEEAFRKAIDCGGVGDGHLGLARLRVGQGQIGRALEEMGAAFTSRSLPRTHAGAYLKLLFLAGEVDQARALIRDGSSRFLPQQLHWAAGVLSLLEGDPVNARRQFARVAGPPSPGDSGAVWRAWASLEAGDSTAAADTLRDLKEPAAVAVALDLAARGGEPPANLLALPRRDLPRREQALALALLHHLRQTNLFGAAQLLLAEERALLAVLPDLAPLRRTILLLGGQQALEREGSGEALACWRPIVDRPTFDADLALRLYPILDGSERDEHSQEAERLASQLQSWVRRAARDDPSAWPEPLLSTTLARLHCWQADQAIRLGRAPQARRAVARARQLAPDHPDVLGRQGLLELLSGNQEGAISLIWQALDGGCRSAFVYVLLDDYLQEKGEEAEWSRLRRGHGATFGLPPPSSGVQLGEVPSWLEALTASDSLALAEALDDAEESSAPLDALRVLVDHLPLPEASDRAPGKLTLALPAASDRWDPLLNPLPPEERVECLLAILVAIQRFCRRGGKAIAGQIARRQGELEALAADPGSPHGERALRALLVLHGLGLKPSDSPDPSILARLRRTPQPGRTLPLALLDLRLFASTRPWRPLVEDLRRQEPENPLLTLVLTTMERDTAIARRQLSALAFEQARRQQDAAALAACRREEEWGDALRARAPSSRRSFGGRFNDIEIGIEEFLRLLNRSHQEDEDAGSARPPDQGPERDPPPRKRPRASRRSFMDL